MKARRQVIVLGKIIVMPPIPSMVVTYDLLPNGADTPHEITVKWSESRAQGFGTSGDNGDAAISYIVALYPGRIPADIASPGISPVGNAETFSNSDIDTREHTFDSGINYNGEDHDNDDETAPTTGEYWVRMTVMVTSSDANSGAVMEYFAKQIVVQPDYTCCR